MLLALLSCQATAGNERKENTLRAKPALAHSLDPVCLNLAEGSERYLSPPLCYLPLESILAYRTVPLVSNHWANPSPSLCFASAEERHQRRRERGTPGDGGSRP